MTTYHRVRWDERVLYEEYNSGEKKYIHYPPLLVQHGVKTEFMGYVEEAYSDEGRTWPPIDKEKSEKVDNSFVTVWFGGMAMQGYPDMWRPILDICEIEVDCHTILESALRQQLKRSEERHPNWVHLQTKIYRVIFKRETALRLLQYIEDNREELDTWAKDYRKEFNQNVDRLNQCPHVLVAHKQEAPTALMPGIPGDN